jgi:hypothetical protein
VQAAANAGETTKPVPTTNKDNIDKIIVTLRIVDMLPSKKWIDMNSSLAPVVLGSWVGNQEGNPKLFTD